MRHKKLFFLMSSSLLLSLIAFSGWGSQSALATSVSTSTTLSQQASAANGGWIFKDADDFSLLSANGKAQAIGTVKWYHGKFPFGYRHRGEYSNFPIVLAIKPIGCIWARITWGYPTSSVSFPPGGSIQGAEKVDGFFVNCRTRGSQYPAVLSLSGLAYAKALLNSTTLTICTSATKQEGARYCGTKKITVLVRKLLVKSPVCQ